MDSAPSKKYHPPEVRAFNRRRRALNCLGLARIDLSLPRLLAEARRQTGLDRFGDPFFMPALERLLIALESEARLNPFGRMSARNAILRSLRNRLWANACFETHPEIRQRPLAAPLIIVGPIRSGTTRLQRMLATDSRFQHLTAWEGFNPAPRGTQPDAGLATRRREVVEFLAGRRRVAPGADAAHPMDPDWAEEEILLLNHSFCGLSPVLLYQIPAYARWLVGHDRSGGYRYMADLMRLISWSRGKTEHLPWVMKTPQHMLDIDVLATTFPEARFVFIHRDPAKTTASTFSLAWNFSVLNTDMPCRASIRDTWLPLCERMARSCLTAREALPKTQQLDVFYADMNDGWRAVMGRIYQFCGMDFSASAEAAMATWLTGSERENRHGGHRYLLEDFGITDAEVDARMMFVREKYAIPYEGKPPAANRPRPKH